MAAVKNRYTRLIEAIFEKYYRLARADELSPDELQSYRQRPL